MLVMVPSTLGPGSRSVGGVARAVGSGITGNDCVFQSNAGGADADAAASTFGHKARRLVSCALVDAAVAGLSVIKTQSPMLHIDRGRIVVRNSGAIREAAGAVHAATAVGLSAIAAVTANCEVVGKRRGIELMFHRRHQKKRASALLMRLSRECHLGAPQHWLLRFAAVE